MFYITDYFQQSNAAYVNDGKYVSENEGFCNDMKAMYRLCESCCRLKLYHHSSMELPNFRKKGIGKLLKIDV